MNFTEKDIKKEFFAKLLAFIIILIVSQFLNQTTLCFAGDPPRIATATATTLTSNTNNIIFNLQTFKQDILSVSPVINDHYLSPKVIQIIKPLYISGNTFRFHDALFLLEFLIESRTEKPSRNFEWLNQKMVYFMQSELDYAPLSEHDAIRARQLPLEQCRILVEEVDSNYREYIAIKRS